MTYQISLPISYKPFIFWNSSLISQASKVIQFPTRVYLVSIYKVYLCINMMYLNEFNNFLNDESSIQN